MEVVLMLALLLAAQGLLCASPVPVKKHSSQHVITTPPTNPAITKVHIVMSNHLDVGFHSTYPDVPGSDLPVLTRNLKDYIPSAIQVAQQLRDRVNGTDRLRYMTHSFLASLYIDCPPFMGIYCPSPEETTTFHQAVQRGDIFWHALPFNTQPELYNPALLTAALNLTHTLDTKFNLPPKTTVSQRDVPGLTRAAIPILTAAGVKAVSVGVNSGSAPPGVPLNTAFIWRDPASQEQLFVFFHPGGYADYYPGWWDHFPEGVPPCVVVPGWDRALCTAWRNDNEGPPSVKDVLQVYQHLGVDFPGAEIIPSDFEDYVMELEKAVESGAVEVPVVTAEIGDNWIGGVASDPGKVAVYKAMLRFMESNKESWGEEGWKAFARMLIKIPEHTWGTDSKQDPGDYESWTNAEFHAALEEERPHFMNAIQAWERQRKYLQWAMDELVLKEATVDEESMKVLKKELEDMHCEPGGREELARLGFEMIQIKGDSGSEEGFENPLVFDSHAWHIQLDEQTGAITTLGRKAAQPSNDLVWVSEHSPMPQLMYSTYNESDFNVIWDEYAYFQPVQDWFKKDLGKPGASAKGAVRLDSYPSLTSIHIKTSPTNQDFHILAEASFDPELVQHAGAPQKVWLEIRSPADSDDLFVEVVWVDKAATRMPETVWLQWQPNPDSVDVDSWVMHKLGSPISPLEVMKNGSYSLHAVGDEGISVDMKRPPPTRTSAVGRKGGKAAVLNAVLPPDNAACTSKLHIRSLDAPIVSPGSPNPFPEVNRPPDMTQGMAFNLVNNIWGTNYIMWYPYEKRDAVMRFKFVVQTEEVPCTEPVAASGDVYVDLDVV